MGWVEKKESGRGEVEGGGGHTRMRDAEGIHTYISIPNVSICVRRVTRLVLTCCMKYSVGACICDIRYLYTDVDVCLSLVFSINMGAYLLTCVRTDLYLYTHLFFCSWGVHI